MPGLVKHVLIHSLFQAFQTYHPRIRSGSKIIRFVHFILSYLNMNILSRTARYWIFFSLKYVEKKSGCKYQLPVPLLLIIHVSKILRTVNIYFTGYDEMKDRFKLWTCTVSKPYHQSPLIGCCPRNIGRGETRNACFAFCRHCCDFFNVNFK